MHPAPGARYPLARSPCRHAQLAMPSSVVGVARDRSLPQLLVEGPAGVELVLDLLTRLGVQVVLELFERHHAVAVRCLQAGRRLEKLLHDLSSHHSLQPIEEHVLPPLLGALPLIFGHSRVCEIKSCRAIFVGELDGDV